MKKPGRHPIDKRCLMGVSQQEKGTDGQPKPVYINFLGVPTPVVLG